MIYGLEAWLGLYLVSFEVALSVEGLRTLVTLEVGSRSVGVNVLQVDRQVLLHLHQT